MLHKTPGVAHAIELSGFSLVSGAQDASAGSVIAIMEPWDQRNAKEAIPAVIAR